MLMCVLSYGRVPFPSDRAPEFPSMWGVMYRYSFLLLPALLRPADGLRMAARQAPPAAASLESCLMDAVVSGDAGAVSHSLQLGAATDFEREGATPLIAAAQRGRADLLQLLLAGGASPDFTTHSGDSALRAAAVLGDVGSCEALLAAGAAPDLVTVRGTALIAAAGRGETSAVSVLLSKGASPSLEIRGGLTPLIAAVREGRADAAALLGNFPKGWIV